MVTETIPIVIEDVGICIKRYEQIKKTLKLKDPPVSPQIITEAKPMVTLIEKGDSDNTTLWTSYMKMWHPRGFNGTMGRNIKFFIVDKLTGCHLGALSIGTPVYALEARDKFIGWTAQQRIERINKHVANNWRLLVFPYVNVKNLGSQVLSQLNTLARDEWKKRYGDALVLLETFVDESECKGAGLIYKAAGWCELINDNGVFISHFDAKAKGIKNPTPARTKGHSFVIRRGVEYGDTLRGLSRAPMINTPKKIFLKPLHRYWKKTLIGD